MSLVLGNISALEYWRRRGPETLSDKSLILRATQDARSILQNHQPWAYAAIDARAFDCGSPIHVIVASASERARSDKVTSHVWSGEYPETSFAYAHTSSGAPSGHFVSTPEFTFLQLANRLSLIELIYLAYELCGSYRQSDFPGTSCATAEKSPPLPGRRIGLTGSNRLGAPLTSTAKLRSFLSQCRGLPGVNKSLRAVKYANDNSASQMETVLAMLLCLPRKLGGYGLPAPSLNQHIPIPHGYRHKAGSQYFKCDLYWPQSQTALEYDSDRYHTETQKITEDALRRNNLEAIGISMMTATLRQVFDGQRLYIVAHGIARQIGWRLRDNSPEFVRANTLLRDQLHHLLHNSI